MPENLFYFDQINMLRNLTIDWVTVTFESGTPEQFVVKELLIDRCYDFNFDRWNDVVLNLWGHIWCFDLYAFQKVKQIVTYEPMQDDYDKLIKHLQMNKTENVIAINKAVVWEKKDTVEFFTTQSWHHSLLWEWELRIVPSEYILDIFENYKFTKIKCDIEGGEYWIFQWLEIPETVNEMRFETHTFDDIMICEHENLKTRFEQCGFKVKEIKNDVLDRTFLLHCTR